MRLKRRKVYEIIHLRVRARRILFIKPARSFLADIFIVLLAVGFVIGLVHYIHEFFGKYQEKGDIDLSLWNLPKYTFFFSRGMLAYFISLIFSIIWGFWAAKDRFAEKFLIPILDVLQSIPILGFMPGLVLLFISLFQKTNVGLELAAIILMFTSQAWNMAFGVYQSMRTVPTEMEECATAYGFSGWQKLRSVEIPFTTTSLIFNSIMSVAGGWFFLMVNEAFQLGKRDFRIPGIGSYMSVAADQGNVIAMMGAAFFMILLIMAIDQLIWRPLVVWSQKFRIEQTASPLVSESWFLHLLNVSLIVKGIKKLHIKLKKHFSERSLKIKLHKQELMSLIIGRGALFIILILMGVAGFYLSKILIEISLQDWIHTGKMLFITFTRVVICLIISILIALPLGLFIGLSEKYFLLLQPAIQVLASFPSSLLFPAIILVLTYFHIPLGISSTFLMLAGSQWYILFNVIAGARALPSDLKEAATSFTFSQTERFKWFNLPGIFPYLITGVVSASGGAWNTSIVAEYVSFKGKVLTTPGIGSAISSAAQNNDIPSLVSHIFVMVIVVGLINYFGWLRLYNYSEKHFTLNY